MPILLIGNNESRAVFINALEDIIMMTQDAADNVALGKAGIEQINYSNDYQPIFNADIDALTKDDYANAKQLFEFDRFDIVIIAEPNPSKEQFYLDLINQHGGAQLPALRFDTTSTTPLDCIKKLLKSFPLKQHDPKTTQAAHKKSAWHLARLFKPRKRHQHSEHKHHNVRFS